MKKKSNSININHSKKRTEKEFEELSDKYYTIIDEILTIFKKEDLSISESIILLDAILTSVTEAKIRQYKDIKEIF